MHILTYSAYFDVSNIYNIFARVLQKIHNMQNGARGYRNPLSGCRDTYVLRVLLCSIVRRIVDVQMSPSLQNIDHISERLVPHVACGLHASNAIP